MHVRYLQHQHQGTVQLLLMPLSTAASSLKSSKWVEEDEEADCDAVPLPIQTFLWRQTNPFLGAKIGKLHEASCVTFERVVVQNILHGLSPSLSDALNSVSRWKLIRAALPHVIQCCGSLMESNADQKGLSPSLQKVLYILHWMLFDAAAECAETTTNKEDVPTNFRSQGLFSLASIQIFVYLICPLADCITEEDITSNIRLESGLKLWQAIWQFRQPDVYCFSAPVKQRKDELPQITFVKKQTAALALPNQGIYLGEEEKPRRPSIVPPPKPPRTDKRVLSEKRRREQARIEAEGTPAKTSIEVPPAKQPQKPTGLLIDVGPPLPVTSIVRSVSEYKAGGLSMEIRAKMAKSKTQNAFDISPTSDSSLRLLEEVESAMRFVEGNSMSGIFMTDDAPLVQLNDICSGISMEPSESGDEMTCDFCGRIKQTASICECSANGILVKQKEAPPLVLTRASTKEDSMSSCSQLTVIPAFPPHPSSKPPSIPTIPVHKVEKSDGSQRSCDGLSTDNELEELGAPNPTIASFLDVAVIRALLIIHWQEQGVYWAMRYLLNRLEEIQGYASTHQGKRQRSNSFPMGEKKPEISIDVEYQNATWEDLQLKKIKTKVEIEDRTRLHVAFNDGRRKSTDNVLTPHRTAREIRRCSLNMAMKRERNRSDPSLSNSIEVLSIREDSGSISNLSAKSTEKEKKTDIKAAQYYPEALGSSNFIEKNGTISLTVIVQTINQVMERCSAVRLCELALNIADTLLRTPGDQSELFFTQLTLMIFRIYLSLGCPHGCNEGVKSQQGDFLRVKAKAILANLEKIQEDKFRKILDDYVEESSCQQVLDLLHSITAFCRSEYPDGRRASEIPSYRNRFNEREKGIEGRILAATFKGFTSKLSAIAEQLEQPENMSLLHDVRMLVNFVQEHHGNPFRRVGLSAMIDALDKTPKVESSIISIIVPPRPRRPPPHISLSLDGEMARKENGSGKNSPSSLGPPSIRGEASLRRGLFKKKDKSGLQGEDSDADSSPSTPRTVSSMDEGMTPSAPPTLKKKSAPKLHFAFNLLKNVRNENVDDEYSDSEAAEDGSESEVITVKRVSRDSLIRKAERSSLDARGNLRLWNIQIPNPVPLSVKGIFEGTRRFAFLLETARPGTFPDPPLIAALLHLKAPVLARAALLMECCHFVSRCNRGQWPEWIRNSHHRTLSSLGGPLANRGTPSGTRKMHSLQRSAGRLFYQWAFYIGDQLAQQLEFPDHKDKKELKMLDSMEDYFDDALVNTAPGTHCPLALQMIAVLLLQEITAFLRETFRTIPRNKQPAKTTASSGWEKLLSHRRWSILSNTFNGQGSINSIAENNLHLGEKERRISLSTAEGDSPRGSKDAINDEIVIEKRGSVRPPSLSVRLLSRQSTHDDHSAHGSTKSATYVPETETGVRFSETAIKGKKITTGRQRLLKRGTPTGAQPSLESSHKRRSLRIRKPSKQPQPVEEHDSEASGAQRDSLKPTDELPLASPTETLHATSQHSSQHGSGYGQVAQIKASMDDDEQHISSNFPWVKVVMKFANSFDLNCDHDGICTVRCFERVSRSCQRLCEALETVYGQKREIKTRVDKRKLADEKFQCVQQSLRRPSPSAPENNKKPSKPSLHSRQSAAVPRRESAMVGQAPEYASKAIKAMLMEKMMQEKAEKEKEESVSKKPSVDRQSESTLDEPEGDINRPMLDYLSLLALNLIHSPLSVALKSALLLTSEQYKQLLYVSWKLLLNEDPHIVASAASMFIISCVKRPEDAIAVVNEGLDSRDVTERTASIQRWYSLWRHRQHVWLKMEEGAQQTFKVPPASVDFQPLVTSNNVNSNLGQPPPLVVDPPWMPHLKTNIEELSLKEEEQATSQTIMTMTRTRRKQKQEMVRKAVRDAEERQCEQRQLFRLRNSAIVQLASFDPGLIHHQQDQSDESEAPHHNIRQLPLAPSVFPSSLLSVVPAIVELLDDSQVDANGVSVSDVAKKIVWTCIVEEPTLFFRHFLEKLTNRDRQAVAPEFRPTDNYEYLMSLLRRMVLRFHPLPTQVAQTLLNYLFGFVLHFVRPPQCDGSEKALGLALSLTWILAPNVYGLYFKDLKQLLKRSQLDQALLITAHVPSAKKIVVHGPDSVEGGIPSQFPVHEDTQFQQILTDSLEFFNIEDDVNLYFLTDSKTGQIHLSSGYVRDFYFFHRSDYPQLSLVKLENGEAQQKMKQMAFSQRFMEVGKVLLTHNILKYSPQNVIAQRIFFLHDELTHLPSFPRKSLETCFGLHHGKLGDQLKTLEALHKFSWANLISDMFEKMENAFMFADLHLFINVINGIMILHCEDLLILRRCAATYICMCIHFNSLFASQGFFLIMPTILRCYSQRQTNRLFCSVVEFLCRQFYLLHRKPFLLQMCGSIANILDTTNSDFEINPMKVKAKYWYYLLRAMENMSDDNDPLDILGLVPYEKPLKALDLCYRDDPNTFSVLTDCFASCICVCAFAPESKRSYHMLVVMAALLPHMIKQMETDTITQGNSSNAAKMEIAQWTTLCVEMKALINSCDALSRGSQRAFELGNVSERGKSFMADSPQFFDPPTTNDEENIRPYHLREKRSVAVGWEAAEVEEQQKEQFRRPRDILLCVSSQFLEMAVPRLKELTKLSMGTEHVKIPEIMDHKCHVKLGEVALTLLKIAPYDLATASCQGLQKYFLVILPLTDWSIESNRSALNIILRRLDKTIAKIAKKQTVRRRVSWQALSSWLVGICDTLSAYPYIAHLHPLKTTTQLCLRIVVGDPCQDEQTAAAHPSTVLHPTTPPNNFCQAVLRLATILMQALGQASFSLEYVTSAEAIGPSADRLEAVLCHLLIPLFLRVTSHPKEASVIQAKDLSTCLTNMQNAVSPPLGKQSVAPLMSTSTLATTFIRGTQVHDLSARQGSVSVTDRGHSATVSTHRIVRESVCQSVYLALKVLMLCFGKLLATMWPRVGRLVKDLLAKKPGVPCSISFVDFLLQCDLPIALLILPVIHNKLKLKSTNDLESAWQADILERIERKTHQTLPVPVLVNRCYIELAQLKEELATKPMEMARSYTPTMTDAHSGSSEQSLAPRAAPSRQSIDRRASSYGKKTLAVMKEAGEGTIMEDAEDENADTAVSPSSTKVTKSPSVPLAKTISPRGRSASGFGMWRSFRRKSRNVSVESDSGGALNVEMKDLHRPDEMQKRRSTEALVLPLHDSLDSNNRQRFVSFSTPKKNGRNGYEDDEDFQIFEQHQVV